MTTPLEIFRAGLNYLGIPYEEEEFRYIDDPYDNSHIEGIEIRYKNGNRTEKMYFDHYGQEM